MRTLGLVMLVGCNGKDDAAVDGTGATTDDTTPISCDIPPYDLPSLSCDQLGSALETTVGTADACTDASDCWVFRAECEHWNAVGCYYPVNNCVDAADLGAFNTEAAGCATTQVCDCGGPPDVDCVGGTCQFVNTYRR